MYTQCHRSTDTNKTPQKLYIAAGYWIRCVLGGEGASRPLPPNPPPPLKPSHVQLLWHFVCVCGAMALRVHLRLQTRPNKDTVAMGFVRGTAMVDLHIYMVALGGWAWQYQCQTMKRLKTAARLGWGRIWLAWPQRGWGIRKSQANLKGPVYLPSHSAQSPEFPTLSVAKPTRSDPSRAGPLSLNRFIVWQLILPSQAKLSQVRPSQFYRPPCLSPKPPAESPWLFNIGTVRYCLAAVCCGIVLRGIAG